MLTQNCPTHDLHLPPPVPVAPACTHTHSTAVITHASPKHPRAGGPLSYHLLVVDIGQRHLVHGQTISRSDHLIPFKSSVNTFTVEATLETGEHVKPEPSILHKTHKKKQKQKEKRRNVLRFFNTCSRRRAKSSNHHGVIRAARYSTHRNAYRRRWLIACVSIRRRDGQGGGLSLDLHLTRWRILARCTC